MRFLPPLLAVAAIVLIQAFYGGLLRPVLALPGFVVLGGAALTTLFKPSGRSAPWATPFLLTLALAGWLLWRCAQAPATSVSEGWFLLIIACAVMYLILSTVSDARVRLVFVAALFLPGVIQSAVGAFQFIRHVPDMPFDWVSEQLRAWYGGRPATRAHGFYVNANHLAWFLNAVGLSSLAAGCWARWPTGGRVVAIYAAATAFAACLATMSRGGFIGLSIGLSVFLLASGYSLAVGARGRRILVTLTVSAGVLVACGAAYLTFAGSYLIQDRLTLLTQDTYRSLIFETTLRQFEMEPLLGGGPGAFTESSRFLRDFATGVDDIFAHNDWIQIAADFGYPALVLVILMVVATFYCGLRGLDMSLHRRMAAHQGSSSNGVALHIGALAVISAFCAHSFFDFNMQLPANALLAAAFAGILANPGLSRSRSPALLPVALAVLCAAAGLALIVLSYRSSASEWRLLQAENALLKGDSAGAIALTSAVLDDAPGFYDARILRARAYVDDDAGSRSELKARAESAAEDLLIASQIRPLEAFGEILLATAEGRTGDYVSSENAAGRAILLFPFYYGGYELLAMSLQAQGRIPEALRVYALASALPDSRSSTLRLKQLRMPK